MAAKRPDEGLRSACGLLAKRRLVFSDVAWVQSMNIVQEIALIFQFIISLVGGTYFVFFSRNAQEMLFFLRKSKYGWLLFLTRWSTEDERNSYIWRFRFVGVGALIMAGGLGRELFRQVM